ncbi:hypothetical protein BN2497_129 [Janthinobacterium sp. CG23_2]|nr:hypothetical protein BN2497_129 [Janthinobacterium sp. CG23_2]CUU26462.1 hypothetical protein BN3177_129 [Janthinobacterium sp. CG23_2]
MDFASAMDFAGFQENAFGQGGFASVDVGNDTEVARVGAKDSRSHDGAFLHSGRSWFVFGTSAAGAMRPPLFSDPARVLRRLTS